MRRRRRGQPGSPRVRAAAAARRSNQPREAGAWARLIEEQARPHVVHGGTDCSNPWTEEKTRELLRARQTLIPAELPLTREAAR